MTLSLDTVDKGTLVYVTYLSLFIVLSKPHVIGTRNSPLSCYLMGLLSLQLIILLLLGLLAPPLLWS